MIRYHRLFAVALVATVGGVLWSAPAMAVGKAPPGSKTHVVRQPVRKHTVKARRPHPHRVYHKPRPHPHRQPWPVTITVQTVPALPSVQFSVDGTVMTTDPQGRLSYTREHNLDRHSVSLLSTSIDTANQHYRFVRWDGQRDPDQAFRPSVTGLPMQANYTLTAAFTVQYPVAARFVNQRGEPVDLRRISTVRVKNDAGRVIDLPKSGTFWLDGSVPSYRDSSLTMRDTSYSLQSVMVDGGNVVDAGKQRFQPAKGNVVTFNLKFQDLVVTAHDALFHTPIGTAAVVTYPDGTVRTVALGPNHSVTLSNLARGQYTVRVKANRAYVFTEQVALTRSRTVDAHVVSLPALGTVGGGAGWVAIGMILVGGGRWRWFVYNPLHSKVRSFRSGRTMRRLRKRVDT